ncbi:MAG: hypothetical protein ABMB14_09000 [Myxococcota bacterium]
MWTFAARLSFVDALASGSPAAALGLLVATTAVIALGIGVVGIAVRWRRAAVTRLGYKRQPNGTFTRVLGAMRIEFRVLSRGGRWVVRTGIYVAADFVAEPRTGTEPPNYAFDTGDDALDARYWFWSERPPFARALVTRPAVRDALTALPAGSVALRGDELVIELRDRRRWTHDAVVAVARAIAA